MRTPVVILGGGFGGLELATHLSEELADKVQVTLIDQLAPRRLLDLAVAHDIRGEKP